MEVLGWEVTSRGYTDRSAVTPSSLASEPTPLATVSQDLTKGKSCSERPKRGKPHLSPLPKWLHLLYRKSLASWSEMLLPPRAVSLASPLISGQQGGQSSSTWAVSYLQSSPCLHHCSAPGPSLTCSAQGSLKGRENEHPLGQPSTTGVWESTLRRRFHMAAQGVSREGQTTHPSV